MDDPRLQDLDDPSGDTAAAPPLRPRWRPESADDARYAYQGHSDADSARYDAAHRSPQPRE